MLGVAAQRIAHLIRKPRNNADECHCAETRRDGAFRAICFVAPLARGACHGRRVASRISSRKASVAATRDLFRGSLIANTSRVAATEAFRDEIDRKSTRLNSSHTVMSYAVFCLNNKKYKCNSRPTC